MNETRFYETNTPGKYATSNAKGDKTRFYRVTASAELCSRWHW